MTPELSGYNINNPLLFLTVSVHREFIQVGRSGTGSLFSVTSGALEGRLTGRRLKSSEGSSLSYLVVDDGC